jgi:hypothetical protein
MEEKNRTRIDPTDAAPAASDDTTDKTRKPGSPETSAANEARPVANGQGPRGTEGEDGARAEAEEPRPQAEPISPDGGASTASTPAIHDGNPMPSAGASPEAAGEPSNGSTNADRPSPEAPSDRTSRDPQATRRSAARRTEGRRPKGETPKPPATRAGVAPRRPLFELPTIAHFLSYSRTPQYVEARIVRALAERRPLDHMLVHGVPGSGTTLFARAIVRDYAPRRVVELDALAGITLTQLARAIDRVGDLGVLVIRHIELLETPCEDLLARAMRGEPVSPRMEGPVRAMPGETPLDRIIRQSAAEGRPAPETRHPPRFTLIGTSHILQRLGYALRTAFDHLVHLREDPKALRRAVVRSLRLRGIAVTNDAAPVLERMLGTVYDCAETLVQTCIERVDLECDLAPDPTLPSGRGARGDSTDRRAVRVESRDRPTEVTMEAGYVGDDVGDHKVDHKVDDVVDDVVDDAVSQEVSQEVSHEVSPAVGQRVLQPIGDELPHFDSASSTGAPTTPSSSRTETPPSETTVSRSLRFTIDRALAISIVEEDLPCRLGDEHYAGALRRHLAGRVIQATNEDEITELAGKLGWSPTTVRTAVETMVREDAAKRIL